MRAILDPFSFVVISIAGWMNQHQQHVIEYLSEEKLPPRSPNLNAYPRLRTTTISLFLPRPSSVTGAVCQQSKGYAVIGKMRTVLSRTEEA